MRRYRTLHGAKICSEAECCACQGDRRKGAIHLLFQWLCNPRPCMGRFLRPLRSRSLHFWRSFRCKQALTSPKLLGFLTMLRQALYWPARHSRLRHLGNSRSGVVSLPVEPRRSWAPLRQLQTGLIQPYRPLGFCRVRQVLSKVCRLILGRKLMPPAKLSRHWRTELLSPHRNTKNGREANGSLLTSRYTTTDSLNLSTSRRLAKNGHSRLPEMASEWAAASDSAMQSESMSPPSTLMHPLEARLQMPLCEGFDMQTAARKEFAMPVVADWFANGRQNANVTPQRDASLLPRIAIRRHS